MVRRPNF
jgi:hypothetical protein